jgi:hypothetical protein
MCVAIAYASCVSNRARTIAHRPHIGKDLQMERRQHALINVRFGIGKSETPLGMALAAVSPFA